MNPGFQVSFTLCCLFLEEVKGLCCVLMSSDMRILFYKLIYILGGVTPITNLWEERLWDALMSFPLCFSIVHQKMLVLNEHSVLDINLCPFLLTSFPLPLPSPVRNYIEEGTGTLLSLGSFKTLTSVQILHIVRGGFVRDFSYGVRICGSVIDLTHLIGRDGFIALLCLSSLLD